MLRVKCNWCESIFYENYIKDDCGEEFCPICGKNGYLMDLDEEDN